MSIQSRSNLILLNKQQLEKFSQYLWGSVENILVAQAVTHLELNGKSSEAFIILTSGALYVFKPKEFGTIELIGAYSIISIVKIAYMEPDILDLTYENNSYVFKSSDALEIGKLLVNQYSFAVFRVPSVKPLKIESTPPSALKASTEINFRPSGLFQGRLITWAHYYDTQFPLQNVRVFKEWDHKHSGPFKLDSSFEHNGAIQALASTISWDSDLKNLVLDNFAPDQLGPFLSTIFKQSFALTNLSIENMTTSANTDFDFQPQVESAISNLTFTATHPPVIIAFFNALEKFNGRIRYLHISSCTISNAEMISMFQSLETLQCFAKLQVLSFDQLIIADFPLRQFSLMLGKLRFLSSIIMNKLDVEGSDILNVLLKQSQLPRHVQLTNLKFTFPISNYFPESVTHFNINNSEFAIETFGMLIKSIFSKERTSPFFFSASNIKGASTKQFLNQLNFSELQPVVYELDWNENHLSQEDMNALLQFVKTQTNLKFLSIEKCITKDDHPDLSLQLLAKSLRENPIEGISIQNDTTSSISNELLQFINQITGCPKIKSIRIMDSQIKDAGIEPVLKMAQECQDLTELDVDGMEISSAAELIHLYDGLLVNSRITSLAMPHKELQFLGINKQNMQPEVKKIIGALKIKKVPKNSQQRLASLEQSQVEIDDEQHLDDINFESMLSIVLPASALSKTTRGPTKQKSSTLDELVAVMRSMVAVMRDEQSERQVDPIPMARMIMDHLNTSKSVVEISNNSPSSTSKHPI